MLSFSVEIYQVIILRRFVKKRFSGSRCDTIDDRIQSSEILQYLRAIWFYLF
jgi:hypothetical protein